jgi:hypothetical protein
MWSEFVPAKGQSPPTPKSRPTGDSQPKKPAAGEAQSVVDKQVAASDANRSPVVSSHDGPQSGDSAALTTNVDDGCASVVPAIVYSEISDAPPASGDAATVAAVATAAGPLRRPLTDADIAKALVYVECGLSLRGAAAEIGRHHSTLLKRIKSDSAVADAFRAAQQKARNSPLAQIREASKTSWRAAAWLVKYLDARTRGGALNVQPGTSRDMKCPKIDGDTPFEVEFGEDGKNGELLPASDAS